MKIKVIETITEIEATAQEINDSIKTFTIWTERGEVEDGK